MNDLIHPPDGITLDCLDDLGRLCNRMHKVLKNEQRKQILLLLKENGPMTRMELVQLTQSKQTSVHLDWLLAACFVSRQKERPFKYSIDGFLLRMLGLKQEHDELRKQKNSSVSIFRR